MTHRVVVTRRALNDIRGNATWLRRQFSRTTEERWVNRVEAAINDLANRPERCPEADEAHRLGLPLRELLAGKRPHVFRILFTIDGSTVEVLWVRQAAQDRLAADDL